MLILLTCYWRWLIEFVQALIFLATTEYARAECGSSDFYWLELWLVKAYKCVDNSLDMVLDLSSQDFKLS